MWEDVIERGRPQIMWEDVIERGRPQIMWEDVIERGRPQITERHMHIACCIPIHAHNMYT
jgi:hypothetical protein